MQKSIMRTSPNCWATWRSCTRVWCATMPWTWRRCLWKTSLMTWITSELHSWYGKFFLLFSEKCPCKTFLPLLSVTVLFNSVLVFCNVPCLFWCCMLASNFSNFRSVEKYVVCSLWGPFQHETVIRSFDWKSDKFWWFS